LPHENQSRNPIVALRSSVWRNTHIDSIINP
jgi:hypothetical protein